MEAFKIKNVSVQPNVGPATSLNVINSITAEELKSTSVGDVVNAKALASLLGGDASDIDQLTKDVASLKSNKVDKVSGKGLSTNDYTTTEKQEVAKIANKVDKVDGKQLSTNDYTTEEKTKLAGIAAQANKTTVENVLTSSSTTNALSAAQGKALKDALDALTARVTALETPAA